MEQQQKEEGLKESIGVFARLFTDNATARILDYFISHRFRSYSADQILIQEILFEKHWNKVENLSLKNR